MEKKIILEELMRIQELMGVSVNLNRLLTEATTYPRPKGSAFNFNMSPALRAQLEQEMVDWGNNVIGLTKRGARVTFGDIVEYGKKLAREASDDAAADEAKALYYVAMSYGRDNFMGLMQKIIKINSQAAKVAFEADVQNIANQTVRNNLSSSFERTTLQNISTINRNGLTVLLDDLMVLKQTINNDTGMDFATKRNLLKIVDDEIDRLSTATDMNYSSSTSTLPLDIDGGTTPNIIRVVPVVPPTKLWSDVEVGVLGATGKRLDLDANPDAKLFKEAFERGSLSESQAINSMVNYIVELRRIEADINLPQAQRQNARNTLANVIETGKIVGGAAGELIVGVASTGTKFLATFSRKGVLVGLIVAVLVGSTAAFGDSWLYSLESWTESTHAACLRKITGYDKAILNTEWLYGSRMEDFIQAEYPEDEICETPGKTIPPDKKIKMFSVIEKEDIFYVTVTYENDCKDTISMPDDSDGVPSFVSKKVCGGKIPEGDPKPKEDGKTEEDGKPKEDGKTEEGGKTLEEFEAWARESYGTKNVSNVTGPDEDKIFRVTAMDETYQYKWVDKEWVYIKNI